jgi:hypothetical protein
MPQNYASASLKSKNKYDVPKNPEIPDFAEVKVSIMWWALRVRLACLLEGKG